MLTGWHNIIFLPLKAVKNYLVDRILELLTERFTPKCNVRAFAKSQNQTNAATSPCQVRRVFFMNGSMIAGLNGAAVFPPTLPVRKSDRYEHWFEQCITLQRLLFCYAQSVYRK